jgi:hypothetical protein
MDRDPKLEPDDDLDPADLDMNHDRALASESWGTTAVEQRSGEPLEVRLAHEEPDPDVVARSVGADGGQTAEEAAMHVVDEPTAGA